MTKANHHINSDVNSGDPAKRSRRDFLKTSTVAAAGTMAGTLAISRSAHAAEGGSDTLKLGLIGCGGRGGGAASQALNADKNVKLTAMADAFADRLEMSLKTLKRKYSGRVDVPKERRFSGFDAYKQVIENVDVVILTTPPHFRPMQLKAAIEAGKHVFCEKPVAVDAPGIKSVLESVELAKKKNLSLVSGLCYRYHAPSVETIKRVHDGAIGDVLTVHTSYNTGGLWHRGRKPDWSEMEWQMRNWLYFTWLSGDHIVEQHIHSLDKAAWLLKDSFPVRATGLGGRQARTAEKWGNIFDHHSVVYEFENGVKVFSNCRQQSGASNDVSDQAYGTKGTAHVLGNFSITGETSWKFSGKPKSMYQVEHDRLFESIRKGKPINNGQYMCNSTMMAIMGRMATYTGKTITKKMAFGSKENLSPAKYEWGDLEMRPIARPGITKFV